MKKPLIMALALLFSGALYALPVGNPSEASLFPHGVWWDSGCCKPYDPCFSLCDSINLRLGFAGDYNFNRHLEVKNSNIGIGRKIQVTEIYTNAAYLAMNICDRVDVFGRLGESSIDIRTDAVSWGSPVSLLSELNLESFLAWSVGGRATLLQCGCFSFGAEGEYFQTVPDVDYFLEYDGGTFTYFGDRADAFYSEWQFALGAAYKISTCCPSLAFVPYIAVKWAGCRLKLDDFQFDNFTLPNLKSGKLWGYAIGLTFTMCEMIGVTAEGRFGDEKAFYINGQARF